MPPRKRRGSDDNSATSQTQGKRQRVSLACDACRQAREKCDGGKPHCGSCVEQKRTCSYTPAAKKRGVPTGYLRTVELSLAWLIEEVPECEDALSRLLSEGTDAAKLLQCKDQAGHRLQKRWSKSSVHKSIGKLLAEYADLPTESPEGLYSEDDAENLQFQDTTVELAVRPASSSYIESQVPQHQRVTLPTNWRTLIDVYFTYTHCWLPIADKASITTAALEYPAEGILLGSPDIPPIYAELWAIFAMAAFQDPSDYLESMTIPARRVYSIARSLIPSEEKTFELPHLRALLLHALVLMGQGAELPAWLLIGTATRLSLHLKCTGQMQVDTIGDAGHWILAACFILDTLASASLGYPSTFNSGSANMRETEDELRRWQGDPTSDTTPQRSLHQLYRFCCFMGQRVEGNQSLLPTTNDLVKSLDPEFSFCNSLLGGSIPPSPSAYLIQLAFLAATIQLSGTTGIRTSLASNLIEAVEGCVSSFGSNGTPPIVVGLLGILRRSQHFVRLHETERVRWKSTVEGLRAVWNQQKEHVSFIKPTTAHQHGHPSKSELETSASLHRRGKSTLSNLGYEATQANNSDPVGNFRPAGMPFLPHTQRKILPSAQMQSGLGDLDGVTNHLASNGGGTSAQPMDYDAILEELGSIDCTDEVEFDPQFMTNLGFGPGCELDDMFQVDFGI